MTNFLGRPTYFAECAPGDLVRIRGRSGSFFALAYAGPGVTNRATHALLLKEPMEAAPIDGGEGVLCYGRNYVIRESLDADSLSAAGSFTPGVLTLVSPRKGETAAWISFSERGTAFQYDIETGSLTAAIYGAGFALTKWSVSLVVPGEPCPVIIYQSA